jgi:hypothetical protein
MAWVQVFFYGRQAMKNGVWRTAKSIDQVFSFDEAA